MRVYMINHDPLTDALCDSVEFEQESLHALIHHRCHGLIFRFLGKAKKVNYVDALFHSGGDYDLMTYFSGKMLASGYINQLIQLFHVGKTRIDMRVLDYLSKERRDIMANVFRTLIRTPDNDEILFECIQKYSYQITSIDAYYIGKYSTYDPLIVFVLDGGKYKLEMFEAAISGENTWIIDKYMEGSDFNELSTRDLVYWAKQKLDKHWDRDKKRIKL